MWETIEYTKTIGDRVERMVRVTAIMKNWYPKMFTSKFSAVILSTTPINWGYRSKVRMDIPERYLIEVLKFSSIGRYKPVYRYTGNFKNPKE